MNKTIGLTILLIAVTFVSGCNKDKSKKELQSIKAQAAAESINFTENAEIENIQKRLKLTSNPGLLGYIVLMNEAGQPVLYTAVKGKITSGSKRLTQSWKMKYQSFIVPTQSDEGTWGSSNPYIYFWDTNGAYHQWNGKYLYSNQPIRLSVKPLVISVKN